MEHTKHIKFFLLSLLFVFAALASLGEVQATGVTSPLQQSGLNPLWEENFTNGEIERLQYSWIRTDNSALTSFVMPGAVYLGKQGGTIQVEQQINNFKQVAGELLPHTIEFDVLSPFTGPGRVSLRPRRVGDMASLRLGLVNDKTSVQFPGPVDVPYSVLSGPSRGWAHVVISYRQYLDLGVLKFDYVVAINNEVHELTGISEIIPITWEDFWNNNVRVDGWSIEHNSTEPTMGKYIANVRGYSQFLTLADMNARLSGKVTGYLAGLSDPRPYAGPKKLFQVHKTLTLDGPNSMAYAKPVSGLTWRFDGSLSSAYHKILTHQWNFGDGQTSTEHSVNHTYASAGTYQVTLTTTASVGGATDVHTITVNVGGGVPPPPPPPGGIYRLFLPWVSR